MRRTFKTWLQDKCVGVVFRLAPYIKDDELYLRLAYLAKRFKIINLKHPKRFNEKLQWLKLHCVDDAFTNLVDKYEVKNIVASKIGVQYIIKTYGVWDRFDDIDFDILPDKFVMKCTHDSGGLIICTDKSSLDIDKARNKIESCMKRNYFMHGREYPYKNVKPRIIAEEYMCDETGSQLKDYKIFCFNGVPKFIEVDYDRYTDHKLNVYDLNWQFVDFYMTSHNDKNVVIPRPEKLDLMLQLASKLAEDTIFVRVDFYSIYDKLYFGELTFHPGTGLIDFHPDKYDLILGDMLKLPYESH